MLAKDVVSTVSVNAFYNELGKRLQKSRNIKKSTLTLNKDYQFRQCDADVSAKTARL